MQRSLRFMAVALLLGGYLLSACAGAPTQVGGPEQLPTVNSNEVLDAGSNGNDSNSNDNANDNANANDNDNTGAEQEFYGVVEAVTDTSITINGVTYTIADFTGFRDIVSVGDQVKIHVIVGADGALIIREIELSLGDDDDDDNSNGNSNDNDDDDNSNGNSNDNDDDDDDNSNGNSNDNDDDDDDNSNGNSNDNDDDDDDDNSNGNSNDND